MSFDRPAFEAILSRMTEDGFDFYRAVDASSRSETVLSATIPGSPTLAPYAHISGTTHLKLSNHAEIRHQAVLRHLVERALEMKGLLAASAPILDHDKVHLLVQAGLPGPKGARVSLSIHGHRITPKAGLLPGNLARKLEILVSRIGHLGRATETWRVNNDYLQAPDGASAYRLWATLALQAAFEPGGNANLHPAELSRVIDASAIHRSLVE